MKRVYLITVICLSILSCKKESEKKKTENDKVYTSEKIDEDIEITIEVNSKDISQLINEIDKVLEKNLFKNKGDIKKRRYNDVSFNSKKIESVFKQSKYVNSSYSYELWSDLIVYKYKNNVDAQEVFKTLKNDPYSSDDFKENNYLILNGDYILMLKSGCNTPKDKWNKLQDDITDMVKDNERFICPCGLKCN